MITTTAATSRTAPELDDTLTSAPAADTASELLAAMAAMPAGHPSRAALRDRAIEAWLPLARHLAHRYSGRGEPTDDLIQTATVGLIKAVDKFDPDRGVDFAGYAIPTIIGEIKRHFRDRTWSIRVPRRLQELRLAITEANSTLTHTLGRSPTVADIATHLGVTEEEVLEGLEGARAYNATSLSTPISADGTTELGDTLGGERPRLRTRRDPRRPRPRPGHPRRARAEDPHPALLRQPDPVPDRRPDRHLPDARLPPAHQGPHQAAEHDRGRRILIRTADNGPSDPDPGSGGSWHHLVDQRRCRAIHCQTRVPSMLGSLRAT